MSRLQQHSEDLKTKAIQAADLTAAASPHPHHHHHHHDRREANIYPVRFASCHHGRHCLPASFEWCKLHPSALTLHQHVSQGSAALGEWGAPVKYSAKMPTVKGNILWINSGRTNPLKIECFPHGIVGKSGAAFLR
ncbi:unnamed protein product [Arctogadus glacialis]